MLRQPPKHNNHNDNDSREDANPDHSADDTLVSFAALILEPFVSVVSSFILAPFLGVTKNVAYIQ